MLAQKEKENVVLRESEARLKASWALEVQLNQVLLEKQRNVENALKQVDEECGNNVVHDSVLSVLEAAGVRISRPSASPPPGSYTGAEPGVNRPIDK